MDLASKCGTQPGKRCTLMGKSLLCSLGKLAKYFLCMIPRQANFCGGKFKGLGSGERILHLPLRRFPLYL